MPDPQTTLNAMSDKEWKQTQAVTNKLAKWVTICRSCGVTQSPEVCHSRDCEYFIEAKGALNV